MHEILADVYKKGNLAGHFSRTDHGGTAYTYAENYIESDGKPIILYPPHTHGGISAKIADRVLREVLSATESMLEQTQEELPFDSHRLKQLTKVLKSRRLSLLP